MQRTHLLACLPVQEEIYPGIEVFFKLRLVRISADANRSLAGKVRKLGKRYRLWHQQLRFTRCAETEILPS